MNDLGFELYSLTRETSTLLESLGETTPEEVEALAWLLAKRARFIQAQAQRLGFRWRALPGNEPQVASC